MPAYRLADGKLEETYQQRNKEQQKHRNARYLGMEYVANRFAHQYREVETPHIKAQILYILHFIHPFWQKPAAQQGKQQRHHQHGSDIAEHHRTHHEERYVCPLLYHREKTRNDDHRKNVGDDRISGQRTDTAAQLLRNHSHSGCRRTDEADEGTLENQFGTVIRTELEDEHYHRQCQRGTDELEDEMPGFRLHLLDFYLTESNIEQGEEHHRHQTYQPRTTIIANGHQEGHIGEYQVAQCSHNQGAGQ